MGWEAAVTDYVTVDMSLHAPASSLETIVCAAVHITCTVGTSMSLGLPPGQSDSAPWPEAKLRAVASLEKRQQHAGNSVKFEFL